MHSKRTVKYVCEQFMSGNQYFYKRELITHDSWDNPESLMWSTPRPVTQRTVKEREKEGYKVEYIFNHKKPAEVVQFSRSVTD